MADIRYIDAPDYLTKYEKKIIEKANFQVPLKVEWDKKQISDEFSNYLLYDLNRKGKNIDFKDIDDLILDVTKQHTFYKYTADTILTLRLEFLTAIKKAIEDDKNGQ